MICPVCHTGLEWTTRMEGGQHRRFNALACPVCLQQKSRAFYLQLQKEYLPPVLAGETDMTLTYPAGARRYHIRLMGEPTHAFCGEAVSRNWFKRYLRLDDQLRAQLCPRCLEVLDQLRQEMS